MMNVQFEGAQPIGKPPSMTDEQCSSAWALPFDEVLDFVNEEGETHKVAVRSYLMCYQTSPPQ